MSPPLLQSKNYRPHRCHFAITVGFSLFIFTRLRQTIFTGRKFRLGPSAAVPRAGTAVVHCPSRAADLAIQSSPSKERIAYLSPDRHFMMHTAGSVRARAAGASLNIPAGRKAGLAQICSFRQRQRPCTAAGASTADSPEIYHKNGISPEATAATRVGTRIGLYGVSCVGKSTLLGRLRRVAGGSAEEKPPILMTFDSGEVLQRLAATGGEGGRVWGELDEAEKDRLRGQCLQGMWPLHSSYQRVLPEEPSGSYAWFYQYPAIPRYSLGFRGFNDQCGDQRRL